MPIPTIVSPMIRVVRVLLLIYVGLVVIVYFRQRSMLFFPTHVAPSTQMTPWREGERTIGFCRLVPNAQTVWLMLHGNGGQASEKDYVLPRISDKDSLYVLEYPGYGSRPGKPSLKSINQAASEAYELLRSTYPNTPVCVLGESIGSGPACSLAQEKIPPDKIVLVVPFDTLANVAAGHYPFLPVRLLLRDQWDNVQSMKHFTGPVDIFGATDDTVIPIDHAKALANQIPNAHFFAIPGRHNEWSEQAQVEIKR